MSIYVGKEGQNYAYEVVECPLMNFDIAEQETGFQILPVQLAKIKFEVDKKSSSTIKFKNQFREIKI